MDMFEFKARRPSGEVVSGKLSAANEAAVVSYIREQGGSTPELWSPVTISCSSIA